MENKRLNQFITGFKNGSFLILKDVATNGYTRILANITEPCVHKDHLNARYKKAKALLTAGLVDEIPKYEVEKQGCLEHLYFESASSKAKFISDHIFLKPNDVTFAVVALNRIHNKKMEKMKSKMKLLKAG